MKLLVLAALVAAVVSTRVRDDNQQEGYSPWQVGKIYNYNVSSHTLARLAEGPSTGSAFRAAFVVRVKAPGQLQVKLQHPQHAQVQHQLPDAKHEHLLPAGLSYEQVQGLEKPFEVNVDGGRVVSFNLPASVPLAHENFLKGLIGALQVDLSAYHNSHSSRNFYDQESQQGLFKKMEADVTGDCETLYSIQPAAANWRRELPKFAANENPIEITKSKNYGHCHHRVSYHFGVPESAEWTGTAHHTHSAQFIKRATVSRALVDKQGQIYKSEVTSSNQVNPLSYGDQKAQVHSYTLFELLSFEADPGQEWAQPDDKREIKTLLYALSRNQMAIHDHSPSSSSESHEHVHVVPEPPKSSRIRRTVTQQQSSGEKQNHQQHSYEHYSHERHNHKHSGSSSSYETSGSSSDSRSAFKNDEHPDINEPAYEPIYASAKSQAENKHNPITAQKMIQQMAQQLEEPNHLPKGDFLSKFNILVRFIASMNHEQLAQTTRSIEVAKSSNSNVKSHMWTIYRDSVVQAGTDPAFKEVMNWVESKKIEGEEAAMVIAEIPYAIRSPSKSKMERMLKLSALPPCQEDDQLLYTVLLAVTKFINMAHVNNDTAHSYYPTHTYGQFIRRNDPFVQNDVIPQIYKLLEASIKQKDDKVPALIQALDNLGHPSVLDLYTPYLEGKMSTSNAIRTYMVRGLSTLAQQKNANTRNALYRIFSNPAEPDEIRAAAAQNLLIAQPTDTMLQAIAQMSRDDHSTYVRAASASLIEAAAEIKNPRFLNSARSAKAVQPILSEEEFGYKYSMENILDSYENDDEFSLFGTILQTGSKDSLLPKYLRAILKNNHDGWYKKQAFSASFSSLKEFWNSLKEVLTNPHSKSKKNHKYSADKIAEMLNIKRQHKHPLEAAIYADIMNHERIFTFSEENLKQLPNSIKQYMEGVKSGVDQHFTKIFNQEQISVMFPMSSGVPYTFSYKEPKMIHYQGSLKGAVEFPSQAKKALEANLNKEISVTVARNLEGSAGFISPFTNQHFKAGVVNKVQINLPLKLNLQINSDQVKIKFEPLHPEKESTVFHYSVWPYVSNQKKDAMVPISQDPATKIIERSKRAVSTDYKFGQSTGVIFHWKGYSDSSDYDDVTQMFKHRDLLPNIAAVFSQKDVAMTHYNLVYLGKHCQNKGVTITAAHDVFYNQKQGGQIGPVRNQQDISPNSQSRREALINQVSAGIQNAKAQVLDLSASFEGPLRADFVITAAVGSSPANATYQYALFAGRNLAENQYQVNLAGKMQKPEPSQNYQQAISKDLKTITHETDILTSDGAKMHVKGKLDRTKAYVEDVKEQPYAKKCIQQIANGSHYLPACQKANTMAYAPDLWDISVSFDVPNPSHYRTTGYKIYKLFEYYNYFRTNYSLQEATPKDTMKFEFRVSYLDNYLDAVFASQHGTAYMTKVPTPEFLAEFASIEDIFNYDERVGNTYFNGQYQPSCTIDAATISTFSNRQYSNKPSASWRVALQDQVQKYGNQHDVVILTKEHSHGKQKVYISYRSESGKDVEVELSPAQEGKKPRINVKTTANKLCDGKYVSYWDNVLETPLLEYYYRHDGALVLRVQDNRMKIVYDGRTLVILSDAHRESAVGLCGKMTGDPADDYVTPVGLVDNPEHYLAAFTLNDEHSDPNTQLLKTEAKKHAYTPEQVYTVIRSDQQFVDRSLHRHHQEATVTIIYKSRCYDKQLGPCAVKHQVQFYEHRGEICVSKTPLPACQSHCQGQDYKIQDAQVTCGSKYDQQFQTYREQIQRGQSPTVSGATKHTIPYKVPTTCVA